MYNSYLSFLNNYFKSILCKNKEKVEKGTTIARYDEAYKYLESNSEGIVKFVNLKLEERKEEEIVAFGVDFFVNKKESVFIPVRTIHRIENFYKKPVKIMEAQIGSVLKESDIVRYKDIYGRIN